MKKLFSVLLLFAVAAGNYACSDDDPATDPGTDPIVPPASLAQPVCISSQVTESSFTVSWEAVDGATSYLYTLQHKNAHGAVTPIVPETTTDQLTLSFSDLKAATEYTFRIKALGDGDQVLDSAWNEITVSTRTPAYMDGPWVVIGDATYEKHPYMPSYCYMTVAFTPNEKTATYYATIVAGDYFDIDPDIPDFEPNTEEDLTAYLLTQEPVADNKHRESSWWEKEVIVGVIGVDAEGNPGKLNWTKIKNPSKSEYEGGSGDEESQATLRIQHVVINSAELEGAPVGCFATVYRFEVVDGALSFRYEDGFYAGDFAKKEPAEWRNYFSSISNAYGEGYDGFYSGWKSSMDLEGSDGLYYYDATFWDASMAGETFELLFLAYDTYGTPGAPGCYTVTLPAQLPEITAPTDPTAYRAAAAAANRIARERGITLRRR